MSKPARSADAYCTPLSVFQGEQVEIRASLEGGGIANIEVVRSGAHEVVMWRLSDIRLDEQPIPENVVTHGCAWEPVARVPVAHDWPSGMYLVRVYQATKTPNWGSITGFFVVRRRTVKATCSPTILLVLTVNTYNAYNEFGGSNLYSGSTCVSFERPLGRGMLSKPAGKGSRIAAQRDPEMSAYFQYSTEHQLSITHGSAGWANWERRFAAWAESSGYQIDYAINSDLEALPDLLDGYRLLLSVGHDEYWSSGMRDSAEAHLSSGGNIAFFSGNTCFWQVRLIRNSMICYKSRFDDDPLRSSDPYRTTTMWSDPLVARPENRLTGVSFTRGGYAALSRQVPSGSGGYTIYRPDHWTLDGTGLSYGDVLGGKDVIVGYEGDGCSVYMENGLPFPNGVDGTPRNLEIIGLAPLAPLSSQSRLGPSAARSPELEFQAQRLFGASDPAACRRLMHGHAVMGSFRSNGAVFTTGCTDWSYGLSDPAVARITRNVLNRLG